MHHRDTPVAPTNPIRLMLVDDKLVVREGVRALLDQQTGFHVVAQAASIAEAISLDVRPDVVITDLVLPDAHGRDVIDGLRNRFGRAAIFVLIDRDVAVQPDQLVSGTPGEVTGCVLKTATADEFLSGLRTVAQGVPYVQPSLRAGTRPLGASAGTGEAVRRGFPGVASLTEKEAEVLRFLVLGHTNAEIAALCSVSLRTVEARRARVLQKLGVRTRAELVRAAQELGSTDIDLV